MSDTCPTCGSIDKALHHGSPGVFPFYPCQDAWHTPVPEGEVAEALDRLNRHYTICNYAGNFENDIATLTRALTRNAYMTYAEYLSAAKPDVEAAFDSINRNLRYMPSAALTVRGATTIGA